MNPIQMFACFIYYTICMYMGIVSTDNLRYVDRAKLDGLLRYYRY